MKEGRAQSLLSLVQMYRWTSGVELGLWRGHTTGYLLENAPFLHMRGVDRWERTLGPPKNKLTGECDYSDKDMTGAEAECLALAERFPGRLNIHKCDTRDPTLLGGVPNDSVDFVFIDASHKTADVIADVRAWLPKVQPLGYVTGHDADWPSVRAALVALGLGYSVLPGNVWAAEAQP